jgi:hypothetical protein
MNEYATLLSRKKFEMNFLHLFVKQTCYMVTWTSLLQTALEIREAIFGKFNLHVAVAHEELAYALYVYEYSSGRFDKAR